MNAALAPNAAVLPDRSPPNNDPTYGVRTTSARAGAAGITRISARMAAIENRNFMTGYSLMLLPISIESWSVARLFRVDGSARLFFVTRFERVFVCLPCLLRFVVLLGLGGLVFRVHVASYSATRNAFATLFTPLMFIARSLIRSEE